MARILIAASSEPSAILGRILVGHELWCAETMAQAEQSLSKRSFDLIICTVVFDESSMFDLLRLAKSHPQWQQIPFLCGRVSSLILTAPGALDSVAFTCRELGATAFMDLAVFQNDAEGEMRETIEKLISSSKPPIA
jgi:hypothetical protein